MQMANDNDPKQLRFGIVNAYNYWIEVIQPNWINFENAPTPRTAFNLAGSLWNVIEWIKHDPVHGMQDINLKEIQSLFQERCAALGIVHDLGTHGKHYTVSKPRGNATVVDNELTGAIICFNTPFGPVSEQTAVFSVVLEGGAEISLNQLFREIMNFWHGYFSQPR
jgi:hypothetical protein